MKLSEVLLIIRKCITSLLKTKFHIKNKLPETRWKGPNKKEEFHEKINREKKSSDRFGAEINILTRSENCVVFVHQQGRDEFIWDITVLNSTGTPVKF